MLVLNNKIVFLSFDQYEGEEKKIITTGANIVLFNHFRIVITWLINEWDANIEEHTGYKIRLSCSLFWIFRKKSLHYSLIHFPWYTFTDRYTSEDRKWHKVKCGLHCDLFNDVYRLFLRIKNKKRIHKIIEEINSLRQSINDIYRDPMCGCPEDFSEGWNRSINHRIHELHKLGVNVY